MALVGGPPSLTPTLTQTPTPDPNPDPNPNPNPDPDPNPTPHQVLSKLGLLSYLVRHRRAPIFRDAQPIFCGITIMGGVMGDVTTLSPDP